MSRNARNWMYVLFAILIMCITLGYAYLSTELEVNGTTNITSANWNVYWDNVQFGSNNVTDVTTPATIQPGLTEVTFNVNFAAPGDTYEFTVDAVNDGSINAMISVVSNGVYASNGTTPKNLPDYLEYSVTYSDGITIAQNQLLEAGDTETYKVRVHYKEDITASQLPSTNDNYMFKFSVTYVQATSSATERPLPTFATDSWETIVSNVHNNTIPSYYTVGSTKEVDMGSFGTHTLRIANTTTPAECSTTGFSQTACGFVLEFEDIITTSMMNALGRNNGGWPNCTVRTLVNGDIYNSLPSTLKNAIINTTVVSGRGSNDSENFTSTDKIYLFSPIEIWGNNSYSEWDSSRSLSRQLDYYYSLGINDTNYAGTIKMYNDSVGQWWLRSAAYVSSSAYSTVGISGNNSHMGANFDLGVSPAFRLG